MSKLFAALAAADPADPVVHGRELHIWGRALRVPQSTSHVALFAFEELCGRPLSAADYLEVTRKFGTVFLCDVPRLGLGEKDKVRWVVRLCSWSLLSDLCGRRGGSSRLSMVRARSHCIVNLALIIYF